MSEEIKNPPRAQIFRYFRIKSRNNNTQTLKLEANIKWQTSRNGNQLLQTRSGADLGTSRGGGISRGGGGFLEGRGPFYRSTNLIF